MAADHRDEDERRVLHLAECLMGEECGHGPGARSPCSEGSHVSAGREEFLRGAGDQHRSNVGVDPSIVDGAGERAQKRVVVAVGRWPIEHDDSDRAFLLQPHWHGTPPNRSLTTRLIIEVLTTGSLEGCVSVSYTHLTLPT